MAPAKKNRDDEEFRNALWRIFAAVVLIAVGIFLVYALTFGTSLSSDHARWAEFGAFASGTVGSIISFFAFFALLLTIILQNKAIRMSKEELQLTRRELQNTSESARIQAKNFIADAKINDVVESIKELEREIWQRESNTLIAMRSKSQRLSKVPLIQFLSKNTFFISRLSPGDAGAVDATILGNRHEELGHLFKLLFDQIMTLRDFQAAESRYRVFIYKHLETFYYLSLISALPFDWRAPLDEESKTNLKVFERNIRIMQQHDATA